MKTSERKKKLKSIYMKMFFLYGLFFTCFKGTPEMFRNYFYIEFIFDFFFHLNFMQKGIAERVREKERELN